MQDESKKNVKMLLIDTCGEGASVALSVGDALAAQAALPGGRVGGSSAEIVSAVGRMLQDARWGLQELGAVGVVSGPGSFTGVRVGMATAKGLCEAAGVKMIAVSRLEVLAEAVELTDGVVALDAGRGELYVGERMGEHGLREWLGSVGGIAGQQMFVAEAKVAAMLGETPHVLRPITMEDVLRTVLREFGAGDMTLVDANYVRRESDIYSRPAAAGVTPKMVLHKSNLAQTSAPSGAEAPVFTGSLTAGLKPRPFKTGLDQGFPKAEKP